MTKIEVPIRRHRVYCPGAKCKRDRNVSTPWAAAAFVKATFLNEEGRQVTIDSAGLCPACMSKIVTVLGASTKVADPKKRWFDIPQVNRRPKFRPQRRNPK